MAFIHLALSPSFSQCHTSFSPSFILHTVHSPTVSITSSPSNSTLGKNLSVTCTSANQYGSGINSIPVTTHIVWLLMYSSGREIINDTFEENNVLNLSTSMFYSELYYSPLLTAINFTCTSYLSFPSERVSNSEVTAENRKVLPQGKEISESVLFTAPVQLHLLQLPLL